MTDFSYAYFIRILDTVGRKYEIHPLADGIQASFGQQLFLRHDVDVSISHAMRMSAIEAERGIRATYMFIPNSRLYDIKRERAQLRELVDMGHEVALHFDVDDERREKRSSITDVLEDIEIDCQRISDVSDEPVRSLSFHRPMPQFLRGELTIAGRTNAYAEVLMKSYISDSRAIWRCGEPIEYLENSQDGIVQLLIHPIWWSEDGNRPEEQLERFFLEKTDGLAVNEARQFDADLAFTVPAVTRTNYYG